MIIKCGQLVSQLGVEQKQQDGAAKADVLRVQAAEVEAAMWASEHKHT